MRCLNAVPLILTLSALPAYADDSCVAKISSNHSTSTAQMSIELKDLGEWSDDAFQVSIMAAMRFVEKKGCKSSDLDESIRRNKGSCVYLAKNTPATCLFHSNLGVFSTQETYDSLISVVWFNPD